MLPLVAVAVAVVVLTPTTVEDDHPSGECCRSMDLPLDDLPARFLRVDGPPAKSELRHWSHAIIPATASVVLCSSNSVPRLLLAWSCGAPMIQLLVHNSLVQKKSVYFGLLLVCNINSRYLSAVAGDRTYLLTTHIWRGWGALRNRSYCSGRAGITIVAPEHATTVVFTWSSWCCHVCDAKAAALVDTRKHVCCTGGYDGSRISLLSPSPSPHCRSWHGAKASFYQRCYPQ